MRPKRYKMLSTITSNPGLTTEKYMKMVFLNDRPFSLKWANEIISELSRLKLILNGPPTETGEATWVPNYDFLIGLES